MGTLSLPWVRQRIRKRGFQSDEGKIAEPGKLDLTDRPEPVYGHTDGHACDA
jgi:hypothetical protein